MKKYCMLNTKMLLLLVLFFFAAQHLQAQVSYLYEGFDVVTPAGWANINNSNPKGTGKWEQGDADGYFPAFSGDSSSYAEADFLSVKANQSGTISNWFITPLLNLNNGAVLKFYTRTADIASTEYPDRLQVRLSTNGNSSNVGTLPADVGDFTTLLLEVNPQQQTNVYPTAWTEYSATISGLPANTTGRIAFRYYVENGGALGTSSTYIGLDDVTYNTDVLPVLLTSFTGILQDGKALLNWKTANEVNNSSFEVERSVDGHNFYKIAVIASHGNTVDNSSYQYTDVKINEGANYYRLKQLDKDGDYTYSAVINLNYYSFYWSVNGYPGNTSLQLHLDKNAMATVRVVSVSGVVLQTINKGMLSAGNYSFPLSNPTAKGLYIVQLTVDNKTYSKKILF